MLQANRLHLYPLSFLFLLALVFLQACSDSDDSTPAAPAAAQTFNFDSSSLPGTYEVIFAHESGTHIYQFNANDSVLINYADGTMDTERWSVNSNGQLVITGSVNDLFTLTSGDQSSGQLRVLLRDAQGIEPEINTTGTISIQ